MKSNFIKILIILLLILFFGFLIINSMIKFHEGAATMTTTPAAATTGPAKATSPSTAAATTAASATLPGWPGAQPTAADGSITYNFSTGFNTKLIKNTATNSKLDSNKALKSGTGVYFIEVYYGIPDRGTWNKNDLPIIYLNHNLDSRFTVYFSNKNTSFGPGPGTSIYIVDTKNTNDTSFKPKGDDKSWIYTEYAISTPQSVKISGKSSYSLVDFAAGPNKYIDGIIPMPALQDGPIGGSKTLTSVSQPNKGSPTITSIKYEKLPTNTKNMISWNASSCQQGDACINVSSIDDVNNNNNKYSKTGLGALNLVTYYIKFAN